MPGRTLNGYYWNLSINLSTMFSLIVDPIKVLAVRKRRGRFGPLQTKITIHSQLTGPAN